MESRVSGSLFLVSITHINLSSVSVSVHYIVLQPRRALQTERKARVGSECLIKAHQATSRSVGGVSPVLGKR